MPNRSTSMGSLPIHCVASQWNNAPGRRDSPHRLNRVQRVDHAVGGLDRHQPRVGRPGGLDRVGLHLAEGVGRQPRHTDAAGPLKKSDRLCHRLVFDRRGDDVARGGRPAVSPAIARLLASVADDVKTICPATAPSNPATESRLCWTASRAARPRTWPLAGLPNCSRKKGNMASRTASSKGVVALLSR